VFGHHPFASRPWKCSTHPLGDPKFLHVARVTAGAPADKAGIRPGDIITHIAGVPVGFGDELDFLIFMRDRAPGERLILEVVRSGTRLKIVATLGALPEAARSAWERGFRIAREKRATARAQRR
jgi:S1-C subfamily serine protease